jgi:hypothetical protein
MLYVNELKYSSAAYYQNAMLQEIHQTTISVHHAKVGFNYPIIRLPRALSALAGLPARIYQTVFKGALAFMVVIAPLHSVTDDKVKTSENPLETSKSSALTWRR